jgi:hypothetical protein
MEGCEMADASTALGAPQIAAAWVSRKGTGRRVAKGVVGAEIGAGLGSAVGSRMGIAAGQTAETPSFGSFGYLAVSATELVLVKAKQGLASMKLTGEVVARVPRGDVASAELGEGKLVAPFTIRFISGGVWELEVARARRRGAEELIAELTG